MRIRSVELRTTLMINAMYGLVEARAAPGVGAYLAVRTPSVPDYWYGNCLAMPGLPAADDLARWEALFEREHPGAGHRVFLMDAPEGRGAPGDATRAGAGSEDAAAFAAGAAGAAGADRPAEPHPGLAAFVAAGYELSVHDVLATDAIRRPAILNDEFDYRPVRTEGEWAAVVEASLATNAGQPGFTRGFLERKFNAVRAAVAGGHGAWWAAWAPRPANPGGEARVGERCVANLGLFWSDGLARFQDVETDPDFRRRGICRSLVYSACAAHMASAASASAASASAASASVAEVGLTRAPSPSAPLFVIKPEDDAVRRIYEAVGFQLVERSVDLFRLAERA